KSLKNPSFLKKKFFTRCKLRGTSYKFLEKRGKDEIAALLEGACNDNISLMFLNIFAQNVFNKKGFLI
ncbi:MAG: hypothetical protein U9O91_07125, partial [Candidatus Caldatribacteriota bacterium]|nr:hypothetical protein [Candidatus Caldatribacteriota bacterium]